MGFNPSLNQGEELNNKQLTEIFKCAPQGGMRRSHRTNSLVLISNPFKSLYIDRWRDDVLYYTGMGQVGNQDINYSQNRILKESTDNNIKLYLFEVFEDGIYTYIGPVELVDEPFAEKQLDKEKKARGVWIFPLKLIDVQPLKFNIEKTKNRKNKQIRTAKKLSKEELKKRAQLANEKPGTRHTQTKIFERDQFIVEYAKRWARGNCQLCELPAPFIDKDGQPYLHTHHIEWLSNGGEDSIINTIALCPNCHEKMHVVNDPKDVVKLKEKVKFEKGEDF